MPSTLHVARPLVPKVTTTNLQVFQANVVTTHSPRLCLVVLGISRLACGPPSLQAHIGHRIVVVPSVTRKGPLQKKRKKTHTQTLT